MSMNPLLPLSLLQQSPTLLGNHALQIGLTAVLVLGAVNCLVLAVISWKQRPAIASRLYSFLMLSVVLYALGYSLELWSTDLGSMLWSIRIEYLGVANVPAIWLGIGLYYTYQTYWVKPRRFLYLWVIPLMTITAVFTNPYHHLFYTATGIDLSGPFPMLTYERGPFYWIHMVYSFGSFLSVTFLLAWRQRQAHLFYRRQIMLMLIASVCTILITGLHLMGITPIPHLDMIPFAFMVSGLIIGRGMINHHLLDLTPIAREMLFLHQLDGVVVVDNQLRVVDYNPASAQIFGLTEETIGLPLRQILPEPIRPALDVLFQASSTVEICLEKADRRYFEMMRVPLAGRNQRIAGHLVEFHEITRAKQTQLALEGLNSELQQWIVQLKDTEQALRSSQEDYRLLAENSNDVIWRMDLSGHFNYVSPAVARLRGFTPEEVTSQPLEEAICPGSLPVVKEAIERAIHAEPKDLALPPEYIEVEQICKGGGSVWTEATAHLIFSAEGKPAGLVGVSRDISERKWVEAQLRYDATHDPLTGLANRTLLIDRVGHAIERARRGGGPFSVLFLDLDDFKVINDSLGHMAGDQLLIDTANRLTECLKSCDTVARLGGDEFVILIENIPLAEEVKTVARDVLEDLKRPFQLENYQVFITGSIGVVFSGNGYTQPEGMLQDADIAMYRAKALGKARYEIFDPKLRQKAISRLEIANDLRKALQDRNFILHYQPILSLEQNTIIGFEALLRWDDPKYRSTSPSEVIPIAEETGLILGIGKWVVREACRQIKRWQVNFPQDPPLEINVNISAKQFYEPDFVEQIEEEIRTAGLSTQSLVLEITETVFLDNALVAAAVFSRLCDLGIRLQIDDFGTGYSSLGYIHRFPIHTIKIDQSFIRELGNSSKNTELVRAMISMARDLDMETVAEGIETEEQLQELKQSGCQYGQGYLFSAPMAAKSVEAMLREKQQKAILAI